MAATTPVKGGAQVEDQIVRIPQGELLDLARQAFERCGLASADAIAVADTLVQADLRGTYSHGVIRLPFLVARVRKGARNRRLMCALSGRMCPPPWWTEIGRSGRSRRYAPCGLRWRRRGARALDVP